MNVHFITLLVLLGVTFFIGCKKPSVTIANLTCEYFIDPIGIDVTEPRLSWQLESGQRGQKQTANQLLVAKAFTSLNMKTDTLFLE
jgi:alpha-L-rhamnosidase